MLANGEDEMNIPYAAEQHGTILDLVAMGRNHHPVVGIVLYPLSEGINAQDRTDETDHNGS